MVYINFDNIKNIVFSQNICVLKNILINHSVRFIIYVSIEDLRVLIKMFFNLQIICKCNDI